MVDNDPASSLMAKSYSSMTGTGKSSNHLSSPSSSQSVSTLKRTTSKTQRTEEEQRLLPPRSSDIEEDDPDSVSIRPPTSLQDNRGMVNPSYRNGSANRKVPGSLLAPVNTLGHDRRTNSKRTPLLLSSSHSRLGSSPFKKIKLDKEDIDDSEGEDELSRPSYSREQSSQYNFGGSSTGSRRPVPTVRIDAGIKVTEYGTVEENLSSKSYGRKGRTAGWSVKNSKEFSENMEIVEIGSTTRPQYRGTARPRKQGSLMIDNTKTSSPYFCDSAPHSVPQEKSKASGRGTGNSLMSYVMHDQEPACAQTSLPADRGISSDELQYDSVERATQPRPTREHNHYRGDISSHNRNRETAYMAKLQNSQKGRDADQSKLKSNGSNTGFAIKSIARGPCFQEADNMALVLNDAGSGLVLRDEKSDLEEVVQLMKILKVINSDSESSLEIRIETSSSAGTKGNKIDLIFHTKHDFGNFMNMLYKRLSTTTKFIPRTSDEMDRMFKKTRAEHETPATRNNARTMKQAAEVQPKIFKRRPREDVELGSMQNVNAEAQSQKGQKLTDKLQGKGPPSQLEDVVQERKLNETPPSAEKGGNIFVPRRSSRTSGEIDETLNSIYPNRNYYQTRSNRIDFTEPAISEEAVERNRYSVKHGLGKEWKHPLVYPPTGKKKTTVEFSDLIRLDEGQFLNDNLVEFYLRFLAEKLNEKDSESAKSIYWFNTYLFTSLTQGKQGRRINYDSVKKWTRNVDIFAYDYVVVPVNESTHWYIVIICNLPALIQNAGCGDSLEPPTSSPVQETGILEGLQQGDTRIEIPPDDITTVPVQEATDTLAQTYIDDIRSNIVVDRSDPDNEMLLEEHPVTLSTDSQKARAQDDNTIVKPDNTPVTPSTSNDQPSLPAQKHQTMQKKGKRRSNLPAIRTYDPKEPVIITLDSLGLTHGPTIRVLKDYLIEEAENKRGIMLEDGGLKGMTAKGIPQQTNYCDCGLYLLGYMDKFTERPKEFVSKLLRREFDESKDWPKLRPDQMRANIRECVQGLHDLQENDRKLSALPRVSDASRKAKAEEANQPSKVIEDLSKNAVQSVGEATGEKDTESKPESGLTHAEALESALPLDEPDHVTNNRNEDVEETAKDEYPRHEDFVEATQPSLVEEPSLVVLDSQESATQLPFEIVEATSEVSLPVTQRIESITPPTRPKTRGKPEPDHEAEEQHSRKRVKVREPLGLQMGSYATPIIQVD